MDTFYGHIAQYVTDHPVFIPVERALFMGRRIGAFSRAKQKNDLLQPAIRFFLCSIGRRWYYEKDFFVFESVPHDRRKEVAYATLSR